MPLAAFNPLGQADTPPPRHNTSYTTCHHVFTYITHMYLSCIPSCPHLLLLPEFTLVSRVRGSQGGMSGRVGSPEHTWGESPFRALPWLPLQPQDEGISYSGAPTTQSKPVLLVPSATLGTLLPPQRFPTALRGTLPGALTAETENDYPRNSFYTKDLPPTTYQGAHWPQGS